MGWDSFVAKGNPYDDVKQRLLGFEKCLDVSRKGSTFFCAIQNEDLGVYCLVVLCRVETRHYIPTVYYRLISELNGPYQYDCPKKIFKLLTPTTDPLAQKWRANVQKLYDDRKESGKGKRKFNKLIKEGDRVYLKSSYSFRRSKDSYSWTEVTFLYKRNNLSFFSENDNRDMVVHKYTDIDYERTLPVLERSRKLETFLDE